MTSNHCDLSYLISFRKQFLFRCLKLSKCRGLLSLEIGNISKFVEVLDAYLANKTVVVMQELLKSGNTKKSGIQICSNLSSFLLKRDKFLVKMASMPKLLLIF